MLLHFISAESQHQLKYCHLLAPQTVVSNLYHFVWNTKENNLKNFGNQTSLDPIDFHCMK